MTRAAVALPLLIRQKHCDVKKCCLFSVVRTADWKMRAGKGGVTGVRVNSYAHIQRGDSPYANIVFCLWILMRIVRVYFVPLGLRYSGQ